MKFVIVCLRYLSLQRLPSTSLDDNRQMLSTVPRSSELEKDSMVDHSAYTCRHDIVSLIMAPLSSVFAAPYLYGYSSSLETSFSPANKVTVKKLKNRPSQKLAKDSINTGIKTIVNKTKRVVICE